jgi:DNA-binding IclR family transcriptional regulator
MNKIDVVNRALRIPDVFSLQRPERGVTEISKELKLRKATAARRMYTLKECGYLTKSPATNKYRLGWNLAQLGDVYPASVPLREIALPRLKELNSKINETVDLYVVVGKQRLCIDRFESTYEVRPVAQAGKLAPLHAGASGKLLLAFMPEDKIQDFLETETLTALGISGLVNRFTPQRMQSELIPAMLETAAQISRELGYLPASG